MTYKPKPLNLSKIKLSDEIFDLIEILARNQHEIWATNKMKNGYKYGREHKTPVSRKGKIVEFGTHPDLIPFESLPEKIKNVDRENVIVTIKGLIKLDYIIEKRQSYSDLDHIA